MTTAAIDQPRPAATRFKGWPAWAAWAVLAVMLALIAAPQPDMSGMRKLPPHSPPDFTLYRDVVDRMASGQGYYAATDAALRAQGRPTTPALVFREPAEAVVLTALHNDALRMALLYALALAATLALVGGLEQLGVSLAQRTIALTLIATAFLNVAASDAPYMHEVWASLLLVLSLAVHRPGRWVAAVVLGVAACLVRELCLPYLVVMGAFALLERRRAEALGWLAGLALFDVLFAVHYGLAAAQARPGDAPGPSWLALGGWPFLLGLAHWNPLLLNAPARVVGAFLCLSIVGLAGMTSAWGQRVAAVVGVYLAAFCVIGRPDNHYWGILIAPLLALGLAFAPAALADLGRAAFPALQAKTT